MPYVKQEDRDMLRHITIEFPDNVLNPGRLNYLISKLALQYIDFKGESYQTYAEIEGVLSHVSKELYRRLVAPYEDKKIAENGDIYRTPRERVSEQGEDR